MNSKLVRGSLAGVAVIALATGGSTFAAWSDFDSIDDNTVGADYLQLNLDEAANKQLDQIKLAPGELNDWSWVVASREGETVPSAALSATMENLVGYEDGCTNTNSEKVVDTDCSRPGAQGAGAEKGDFHKQALIRLYAGTPTTDIAGACDVSLSQVPAVTSWMTLEDFQANGADSALGTLGSGQGVCVKAEVRLPDLAGNVNDAAQGDSATFDLRFDLKQS